MIDSLLSFILGLVWIGLPIGFIIGIWTGKRELHKSEKEAFSRGWEDQKIVGDRNYVTGYNAGKMVMKARAGIES